MKISQERCNRNEWPRDGNDAQQKFWIFVPALWSWQYSKLLCDNHSRDFLSFIEACFPYRSSFESQVVRPRILTPPYLLRFIGHPQTLRHRSLANSLSDRISSYLENPHVLLDGGLNIHVDDANTACFLGTLSVFAFTTCYIVITKSLRTTTVVKPYICSLFTTLCQAMSMQCLLQQRDFQSRIL